MHSSCSLCKINIISNKLQSRTRMFTQNTTLSTKAQGREVRYFRDKEYI